MRFRLFQYALPADPDLQDLNAFLAGRRVATVSHHVLSPPAGALLVFVVETVGHASGEKAAPAGAPKIDYREVLSEQDFALFSRLRAERRRVAEADGVPVYTVFSNAQLADMVRKRVTTRDAMADVDGVGKARVEKYAASFLPILAAAFTDASNQGGSSS